MVQTSLTISKSNFILGFLFIIFSSIPGCSGQITAQHAEAKVRAAVDSLGKPSALSTVHVGRSRQDFLITLSKGQDFSFSGIVDHSTGDLKSLWDAKLGLKKTAKTWRPAVVRYANEPAGRTAMTAMYTRLEKPIPLELQSFRMREPLYPGCSPTFLATYVAEFNGYTFLEPFVGLKLIIDGAEGGLEFLIQNFRHDPCQRQGNPMGGEAIKAKWRQRFPRGNISSLTQLKLGWGKLKQGTTLGLVYRFDFPQSQVFFDAVTGEYIRTEM